MRTPIWNWGVYDVDLVRLGQAGSWQSNQYRGGWQDSVVDLAPIGPMVPAEVRPEAEAARFKSGEKTLTDVFTGPIRNQSGAEKEPANVALTDEEIPTMNWFVAGVLGEIPS